MHPNALLKIGIIGLLVATGIEVRAQQPASALTLHVMTYNIHHANPPSRAKDSLIDLEAVARVINEAKPDLVALQEVDVHNARAGLQVNEAAELGRLTGMHYYFTRAMYYRGGEYGDAVLSRFPIVDTIGAWLPIVEGTREEVRSLCMVKVALPDHREIFFASTHLGLSEQTRILQARALAGIVTARPLPLILCGDLNARPESRPIAILDSVLSRSCRTGCDLTIPTRRPRAKIDYILFRPGNGFRVLSQKTIRETYASDHLPVVAVLQYP